MRKLVIILFLVSAQLGFGQNHVELKKAAKEIIDSHPKEAIPTFYDTLIDLNGDNIVELLFEYYAPSGTGLKNRIQVYHYDSAQNKFFINNELSALGNPTFYFSEKKIYGYYIANGGGRATQYKWNNNSVKKVEEYYINIHGKDSIDVTYSNFIMNTKRKYKSWRVELPEKYKYMDYESIIRNK